MPVPVPRPAPWAAGHAAVLPVITAVCTTDMLSAVEVLCGLVRAWQVVGQGCCPNEGDGVVVVLLNSLHCLWPAPSLSSYRCGSSFGREPVTTEEAEDYFEVISNPMDFQTIQSKCSCGNYRSVQEFLSDIKQVFSNAECYNQNGSHVLSCLEKTEQCLIDMVHKHLPGHTYARRKRRMLSARCQGLEEQEGDSESEPLEHSRGRKRKK